MMPLRHLEPEPVPPRIMAVVWGLATVLVLAWICLLVALVWAAWNGVRWLVS